MTDWKEIHPDFTLELQREWESFEFTFEECKWWINTNGSSYFQARAINEPAFYAWLREKELDDEWVLSYYELKEQYCKHLHENQNDNLVENADNDYIEYLESENASEGRGEPWEEDEILSGKEDSEQVSNVIVSLSWKDIHKGFGGTGGLSSGKTYQQLWEECGFTHQEAREWIKLGFEPWNYREVKKWKNHNFNPQEVNEWIKLLGVEKKWDYEFAVYLRGKGHQPSPGLNSKQLRVEFNIPKNYLDCFYPPEKRAEITKLSIVSKNLTGELDLSDFVNLEKLNCSYNYELSSLNLSNCLRLKKIECIHNSQLTNLTFPINLTNLKKLRLIYSSLEQNLSFLTGAVNLKELDLRDNKFTGSLDYLSNLKKLEYLDISSTDINEVNIDKLPKSLKCIAYSTTKSPHCQLTSITLQLEKCKYAFCQKCQQPNTSEDWCQPCIEKEWQKDIEHSTTGQEVVEKFIQQQKDLQLQWIPYEKFTDVRYLAEGGFSKIYKALSEKERKNHGKMIT